MNLEITFDDGDDIPVSSQPHNHVHISRLSPRIVLRSAEAESGLRE